ncbi:hypothetical protein NHX12_033486 [Muraenolepis orangiensis]|uniref:Immunoglobulin I-set domain-containing protein n=1 Tax=Muraenolepis orangiensis TaxID=630683 RepID=A0A9Q0E2G2_9TELE|nr:hypothetical protein NHX12_033486 [Muraenolepis orangiensis]
MDPLNVHLFYVSSPPPCSLLKEYLGEKEVQLSLTFDAVEEADLGNYSCHVENHIGKRSGNAILQKKGANDEDTSQGKRSLSLAGNTMTVHTAHVDALIIWSAYQVCKTRIVNDKEFG